MKKIKIFIIFTFIYIYNIYGQNEFISIEKLHEIRNNNTEFNKVVSCDSCFSIIIDSISASDQNRLKLSLIVLNSIGKVTDGAKSEMVSACVFDLYSKFSNPVILIIYTENLEIIKSFLLNEFCMTIDNERINKNKIIGELKNSTYNKKYRKAYKMFIQDFKKYKCN